MEGPGFDSQNYNNKTVDIFIVQLDVLKYVSMVEMVSSINLINIFSLFEEIIFVFFN